MVEDGFTAAQLEAITAADGPLGIIAGPGCGKTTVLAGRIAFLIRERGFDPSTILAVSFTTEAARALRAQLGQQVGAAAADVAIHTLHALGRRVIDTWAGRLGFDERPSVLHRDEGRALLGATAADLGWDTATFSVAELGAAVDRCRLLADDEARHDQPVWPLARAYEERLLRHGAIDFVAMLTLPLRLFREHPEALRLLQLAYRCVLADEAQDLDATQWSLLELLAAKHRHLVVVGDPAQCLPPGTQVQTPAGGVAIESLRPGDMVMAGAGAGVATAARVLDVVRTSFQGTLVRVTLKSGRVLRMTPNHMCFARLGAHRGVYWVYLMYRRDLGYRIGITSGERYDRETRTTVHGLPMRVRLESADRAWLLRFCATRAEATYYEQFLSVTYGLPTMVFRHIGRGLSLDQEAINRLFASIDTRRNAARLMADFELSFEHPHHRAQAIAPNGLESPRLQVHLNIFGGGWSSHLRTRRYHRVRLYSNHQPTEHLLQHHGLATRAASKNTWRIDSTFRDFAPADRFARRLAELTDGTDVAYWAVLTPTGKFSFQPASHLHPTMVVPILEGNRVEEDEIIAVEREPYSGPVFDLNVEHAHNYAAAGIVVHNSIYSWRGAAVRHLLGFAERHPDARVVTLDHSHRATRHLVELANALSDLLAYRPGLVTDNPAGPVARLLAADDEHAEATFIAQQIGALIDRGLLDHPGHAAVLYRTRAQADTLTSALRAAGVPYTMHGHADLFSQRVVRDVLAYLRLACNPADRLALGRTLEAPPRGLGRLAATLVEEPATLAELPGRAEAFGPGIVAGAAALVATIYDLHAAVLRGASPAAVLDRTLDRSGYRGWLEHHPDGPRRLRTLARLRTIAQRAEVGLSEWLDALAVGEEVDPAESNLEAARLSTIHTAKGREWRAVFLPGLEESVLPHYRALRARDGGPDDAALEEELRVLYVAMTRPRERLYLSYCRQRSNGGRQEARSPSRWLYALPPELLASAA